MTRASLAFLSLVVAACGSKGSEEKLDPRAAEGFARTLEAVAGAEPTQAAPLLAQGAFETVAPSMMCFQRFGSGANERARIEALFDCGLACTPEAVQSLKGVEPRKWMAGLLTACKPAHFGIDPEQEALLSPEWFLMHKIGEFTERYAKSGKGGSKARLDQAVAKFKLPLPLPAVAPGSYELAVAPAAASVPVATRTYLIVPASGPFRVGASPYATLGAGEAAIVTPEGRAGFPGNEAAREDLRAAVLEAAGVEAAAPDPVDAAPPPPPDAAPPAPAPRRGQYEMKKTRDTIAGLPDDTLAKLSGVIGLPPGLHGEVATTLRGDLASDREPVPLLLADGGREAAEVIEIGAGLDRVLLGVASPEDPAARALAVELKSVMNGGGRGPGQAHIPLTAGGLEAAVKAAGGREETVVIKAEAGAPWKDAVTVAAVAIARGAKRVVFTSAKLDQAMGTGVGPGGVIGHGASDQGPPATSVITDAEPEATGDLDKGIIRRVMRSRMGAIRACYERELLRKPHLDARVDLEFTIEPEGSVGNAKASGTDAKALADCLAVQVKRVKFPSPRGGPVKVRYPLTFKPAK